MNTFSLFRFYCLREVDTDIGKKKREKNLDNYLF